MKTWRWTLLLVSSGALAFACSVEDNSEDDDSTTLDTTSTTTTTTTNSSVTSSTVSTVASTGGNTCAQQPDFLSCANCYCMQDQAGCQAYIGAIDDNIYCGQTCGPQSTGMECQTFCMDTTMMPDMACDDCVTTNIAGCANPAPGSPAEADCDAFVAQCQADMGCVAFAQQLQTCPD
jgi:hypothetical protein